jgi:hypothetical protein
VDGDIQPLRVFMASFIIAIIIIFVVEIGIDDLLTAHADFSFLDAFTPAFLFSWNQ